jgi:Tfp pilus assembly protein PilF
MPLMRLRLGCLVVLLVSSTSIGRAGDTLVLRDGRRIEVDSWWTDGTSVIYPKYGGTIGIPLAAVESVIDGTDGSNRRDPPPAGGAAYATRVPPGAAAAASVAADAFSPIQPDPPGTEGEGSLARQLEALERVAHADPAARPAAEGRMAKVLTLMGNEAFLGGDADAAVASYERAIGLDPALVPAHLNLGVALLEQGRTREALARLQAALALAPDQPDALTHLGEALYRDDQVGKAIEVWKRAEELAPSERTRERLTKAMREQEVGGEYRASAGAHFTLRYDGARADPALGEQILQFLEERFNELVSRYNSLPESVLVVILYPEREFHEVTQTPQWTGGIYDGKIRVPIGGVSAIDEPLRRVLVHELTHALVAAKSRGNAPTWIQEGLAQREEGERASASTTRHLARAYRLSGGSAFAADLDYASSLAFTEHLISERGFGALLDFLARLGRGELEGDAFQAAFGAGYAETLTAWGETLSRSES